MAAWGGEVGGPEGGMEGERGGGVGGRLTRSSGWKWSISQKMRRCGREAGRQGGREREV